MPTSRKGCTSEPTVQGDKVSEFQETTVTRNRNSYSSEMGTKRDKELGSQERPSTKHPNFSCRSPWASGMAIEHQPCSTP